MRFLILLLFVFNSLFGQDKDSPPADPIIGDPCEINTQANFNIIVTQRNQLSNYHGRIWIQAEISKSCKVERWRLVKIKLKNFQSDERMDWFTVDSTSEDYPINVDGIKADIEKRLDEIFIGVSKKSELIEQDSYLKIIPLTINENEELAPTRR